MTLFPYVYQHVKLCTVLCRAFCIVKKATTHSAGGLDLAIGACLGKQMHLAVIYKENLCYVYSDIVYYLVGCCRGE